MPVDAHMLIALSAPRPVFITGGTDRPVGRSGRRCSSPTVAAGPVYRLLGRKRSRRHQALPPLDTPVTSGDLGWHYHTGGHAATPADWTAFLNFAGKSLSVSGDSGFGGDSGLGTRDWGLGPGDWGIGDWGFGTQDREPEPGTRNLEPGTPNPEPNPEP